MALGFCVDKESRTRWYLSCRGSAVAALASMHSAAQLIVNRRRHLAVSHCLDALKWSNLIYFSRSVWFMKWCHSWQTFRDLSLVQGSAKINVGEFNSERDRLLFVRQKIVNKALTCRVRLPKVTNNMRLFLWNRRDKTFQRNPMDIVISFYGTLNEHFASINGKLRDERIKNSNFLNWCLLIMLSINQDLYELYGGGECTYYAGISLTAMIALNIDSIMVITF